MKGSTHGDLKMDSIPNEETSDLMADVETTAALPLSEPEVAAGPDWPRIFLAG